MKSTNRFSVFSLCFGIAGLLTAIAVTEAERSRDPRFGYFLHWMDRLGWVRQPLPDQTPELKPVHLLDLTDERALYYGLVYSICFAIAAIWESFLAEYDGETSPNAGVGFILGTLALYVHGFGYGMSALLVGSIALVLIRRSRSS